MLLAAVCSLLALGAAALPAPQTGAKPPASVSTLYTFPTGTAVENSVILSNGSLIVSLVTEPSIYRLEVQKGAPPATLAYRFNDRRGCTGVTQPSVDTLAVVAGNTSTDGAPRGDQWAVFLLKLNTGKPATLLKKFEFPQAVLLNGLVSAPNRSRAIRVCH